MSEHEHDWAAVHAIGSGLVKEHQCKCGATDSLSLAWSEAEAALPEGWLFHGVSLADHSMDDATGPDDLTWGPDWVASMTWPDHCEYDDCDHDEAFRVGTGDTPAAALRSLAAKLYALPDPEHRRSER